MKNYININGKKIELSEENVKEIKKQLSIKNILFCDRIKKGSPYYAINWGEVHRFKFCADNVDRDLIASGNFYETREEAQKELDKQVAITTIKNYIAREFGVFDPNWGCHVEVKYSIDYNYNSNLFEENGRAYTKDYSPIGFLRSEEHTNKIISKFKKELQIIFRIQ